MKIIISRKGFDSGFGGVASPIMPDGKMLSFPIPGSSRTRYKNIFADGIDTAKVLHDLTRQKMSGENLAHFDPDLHPASLPRKNGWRASIGQTGAAQSHLQSQGVDVGDIFLFFGWFKKVKDREGTFVYDSASADLHVMFGYLQVGEVLTLGQSPRAREILADYPWLEGHPHLFGTREKNNTLYIASEQLELDGQILPVAGGGSFNTFDSKLQLTKSAQKSRSLWSVPKWMHQYMPLDGMEGGISYHKDSSRWKKESNSEVILQSVAKGQEFVMDASKNPHFSSWFKSILSVDCENTLQTSAVNNKNTHIAKFKK